MNRDAFIVYLFRRQPDVWSGMDDDMFISGTSKRWIGLELFIFVLVTFEKWAVSSSRTGHGLAIY